MKCCTVLYIVFCCSFVVFFVFLFFVFFFCYFNLWPFGNYIKPCLKRPLKKETKIDFLDRLSLNAGQSVAECSKRAFCNTFDLH